ncbi:hypothetical protein [Bradyrhizobium sp. USDA 10063]
MKERSLSVGDLSGEVLMATISEKQRAVWVALNAFIRNGRGVVVSSADDSRMRLQCAQRRNSRSS